MKIYDESLPDVNRYIENNQEIRLEDYEGIYQAIIERIKNFGNLDGHEKILEIGVGTGVFGVLCRKNGLQYKGIEISP